MKNEVVIIGAGNSGRGMLGEMFYNDGQYHVVFADIDSKLVNGLRKQGYYHVEMTNLASCTSIIKEIKDFEIIDVNKEHDEYIKKLASVKLICTALKANGFDLAIKHLTEMIRLRKQLNINEKVYITLGANYVGLYEYFDEAIKKELNNDELDYYKEYIILVMSIVNRKNLKPFTLRDNDPYFIEGDDKPVLRVERSAVQILEPMPIFFKLEDNLSAAMAVKIWSGNVVQFSMAFVALSKGMRKTIEAVYDKQSHDLAYQAAIEAIYGVDSEFGISENVEEKALKSVDVFKNAKFSDDLYRISRQPIRKIGYNDRFIGPARMALKHGKLPVNICKCMAYVFLIDIPCDNDFKELKQSINDIGIKDTVIKYCGLNQNDINENKILELICSSYEELKEECKR